MKPPSRIFVYPVNAQHSTVLGYSARSKHGRKLWATLHWPGAWKDDGKHLLNPSGGDYLHVRAKPLAECCWYRVRCAHSIGSRWRGGVVKSVRIKQIGDKWHWIVTVTTTRP